MRKNMYRGLTIGILVLLFGTGAAWAGSEENKAAVEAMIAALGVLDGDKAVSFYAADCMGHNHRGQVAEQSCGDETKASVANWKNVYSDLKIVLHGTVAEGDTVGARWTFSGTHTGFGKPISINGMTAYRFEDGKIVESWAAWDELSVVTQLGGTVSMPDGDGGDDDDDE